MEINKNIAIDGATFSKDKQTILTWGGYGMSRLWDLDGNILTEIYQGRWLRGAALSKDDQFILTWWDDFGSLEYGMWRIWERNGELLTEIRYEREGGNAIFSEDGESILLRAFDMSKLYPTPKGLYRRLEDENLAEIPLPLLRNYTSSMNQ